MTITSTEAMNITIDNTTSINIYVQIYSYHCKEQCVLVDVVDCSVDEDSKEVSIAADADKATAADGSSASDSLFDLLPLVNAMRNACCIQSR